MVFLYRLVRSAHNAVGHMWDLLNPRAIKWRRIKDRHPNRAIIAKLGKNLSVRVYTQDIIGKDIYVKGMFEKSESLFVTHFLGQGMIFFDIGANLGQYTLLGANCVGSGGQVHSFEPSSRMFSELKFNVELNNQSDICILNNVAVSDKKGTARLSKYEAGGEVYGSIGGQDWDGWGKSIIGYEEVRVITLDEYVKSHNIDHIDLIKMDIEGAELLALRGAYELLRDGLISAIVLEMADVTTNGFGYKAMEIWDYLSNLGYSLHSFNKQGDLTGPAKRPPNFIRAQNLVAIYDAALT